MTTPTGWFNIQGSSSGWRWSPGAYAAVRRLPRWQAGVAFAALLAFVAVPTVLPRLAPAVRNSVAGVDWGRSGARERSVRPAAAAKSLRRRSGRE